MSYLVSNPPSIASATAAVGSRGRFVMKTNGTFTVPTGVYVLQVLCVGAGGGAGGGSAGGSIQGGGAGGSGWPVRASLLVVPGEVLTAVIGVGGAGGGVPSGTTANGVSGGDTTFGPLIAAGGGYGGAGPTATGNPGTAGGRSFVSTGGTESTNNSGGGGGYSGGRGSASGDVQGTVNSIGSRSAGGRRQGTVGSDGGTNGNSSANSTSYDWETTLWTRERIEWITGGGRLSIPHTTPIPARPANTGSGGDVHFGTGAGTNRTGGAGANGIVLIEWEITA